MKSARDSKRPRHPTAYALELAKAELVDLYLSDPEFSEEFERLRERHDTAIHYLLRDSSNSATIERNELAGFEREVVDDLEETLPLIHGLFELGRRLERLEKEFTDPNFDELLSALLPGGDAAQLVQFVRDLGSLADRFGFDYPWAVPRLLLIAIGRSTLKADLSDTQVRRLTSYAGRVLAESTTLQPLVIVIPPALVLFLSQAQILGEVGRKLQTYKRDLASAGVPLDSQDALARQMRWVFARNRHGLKAMRILDSEHIGDKIVEYNHIRDTIRSWDQRLGYRGRAKTGKHQR